MFGVGSGRLGRIALCISGVVLAIAVLVLWKSFNGSGDTDFDGKSRPIEEVVQYKSDPERTHPDREPLKSFAIAQKDSVSGGHFEIDSSPSDNSDGLSSSRRNGYWPDSRVLDEAIEPIRGSNQIQRVRLLEASDLPYLVRVEQILEVDPVSGEETVVEYSESAGDRFLVQFDESITSEETQALLAGTGLKVQRRVSESGLYLVGIPNTTSAGALSESIGRLTTSQFRDLIRFIERDWIVHSSATPNDPKFGDGTLWGLNNTGQNGRSAGLDIDGPEGWDIRTSAEDVIVAVIDSGIMYDHEDLSGNIWQNEIEIPDNGLDDDENGYVDDVFGIDAVNGEGDPYDDNFHGTHCAGIIGAMGNNGIGITGVAWEVQLMACKFLSSRGTGSVADAIICIDYAVENGAKVLNNSWGGHEYSQALLEAIQRVDDAGAVFVAAMGDSKLSGDSVELYPAGYDVPNVISVVGMSSQHDLSARLEDFSNFAKWADVAAPGVDIHSTINVQGEYRSLSGSSMAAAHISGMFALLFAEYPNEHQYRQIERLLLSRIGAIDSIWVPPFPGWPRLGTALGTETLILPPVLVSSTETSIRILPGTESALETKFQSDSPLSYQWYYEGEMIEGATESSLVVEMRDVYDVGEYSILAKNTDGETELVFNVELKLAKPKEYSRAIGDETLVLYESNRLTDLKIYSFDSVEGPDCLRYGTDSPVETFVSGPGILSVQMRSENIQAAGLYMEVEGVGVERVSSTDWAKFEFNLTENKTYRVKWFADNSNGAIFIDDFQMAYQGPPPIAITRHPETAMVEEGNALELFVEAASELDPTYQWFHDDVPILESNSPSLQFSSLSVSDSGNYDVEVSNENGSVRSRKARVIFGEQPAEIVRTPYFIQGGFEGESASFTVQASGTEPISYQWYRDGALLEGETSATIEFSKITAADEGRYCVEVSNEYSTTTSPCQNIELHVNGIEKRPEFVDYRGDLAGLVGDSSRLWVVADGALPITYQWYRGNEPLSGETGRKLEFDTLNQADEGEYRVFVSNRYGTIRSPWFNVTALESLGVAVEQEELTFRMSGTAHMEPQSELTFDGVDALKSAGDRRGRLEAVIPGPTWFDFRWRSKRVSEGSSNAFTFDAQDGQRLICPEDEEWVFESVYLSEEENLVVWQFGGDGFDHCLDTFEFSKTPRITRITSSGSYPEGSSVVLSAEALGAGELAYQWEKDGVAISGANSTHLNLGSIGESETGEYTLLVSNEFGDAESVAVGVGLIESIPSLLEVPDERVRLFGENWNALDTVEGGNDGQALFSQRLWNHTGSMLEFQVSGPANFVFDWKRGGSFPGVAGVTLYLDEENVKTVSDSNRGLDWESNALRIPEGEHTVRLQFFGYQGLATSDSGFWLDNARVTNAPVFESERQSIFVAKGSILELSQILLGEGQLSYEWFKDGELITGETNSVLNFESADVGDSGLYHIRATNEVGSSESSPIEVIVIGNDLESLLPALDLDESGEVIGGGFHVSQFSRGSYWEDQSVISWDGSDALSATALTGRASFDLIVSTDQNLRIRALAENETRRDVSLQVNANGEIGGDDLVRRFRVAANDGWTEILIPLGDFEGDVRLNFSFFRDFKYDGNAFLDAFEFTDEPVVTQQPVSQGLYLGKRCEFEVSVATPLQVSYQWRKDGIPIENAIQSAFVIENVLPDDAGDYDVLISAGSYEYTSDSAKLEVHQSLGEHLGSKFLEVSTIGNLWEISEEHATEGSTSLKSALFDDGDEAEIALNVWSHFNGEMSYDVLLLAGDDSGGQFDQGGNTTIKVADPNTGVVWSRITRDLNEGWNEIRLNYHIDGDAELEFDGLWVDNISTSVGKFDRFRFWYAIEFDVSILDVQIDEHEQEDPDGDGLVNFVEYAFGSDPLVANSRPEIEMFRDSRGGLRVELSISRRFGNTDIVYAFEVSDNLEKWYVWHDLEIERLNEGEANEAAILRTFIPDSLDAYRYIRFSVVRNTDH